MRTYFCNISEKNKLNLNKPINTDMVYYSELNEWYTNNAFRSFSLKYVLENSIEYKVGNKLHVVSSDNFLLACKQPHVSAYFESKKIVKSICIDIRPETINEAFTIMSARDHHDFDDYLSGYFKFPDFFESVSPAKASNSLSQKLKKLSEDIQFGKAPTTVDKEWFLDLVERVIYHEYGNYLALNGIHSVRPATKKEILLRLNLGKQYICENYLHIEDISEVASVCNLSEFHFYRSFKQAFSVTPYQYLLQQRLEFAKSLLAPKELSLTEIAEKCNFPDLPTFSKAFKRRFGVSPTKFGS